MRNLLISFLLLLPFLLSAQSFKIDLSPKHQQKLSAIESGHKRMIKFYKFYKKDSSQYAKKMERRYKKTLDSTYRAEIKRERLERRLAKKGITLPKDKKLSYGENLGKEISLWHGILKDTTSSDSLKREAKVKIKELAIEKAKTYPGFQHLMEKYQANGDIPDWEELSKQVPGMDTLKGIINSSPNELFVQAEKIATEKLAKSGDLAAFSYELEEAKKLKSLPDNYNDQYKDFQKYTDKEYLEQQGRQKAVDEAMNYFTEHADKLQSAQAKMSKLLSKYREFSNANDLSNAVKHTSMEGKTFFEHLLIGGNFNVISTEPFSIDFSPLLGYKFTSRFSLGVGMNFRYTYADSIKNKFYISPRNTSYKAFVNYDVIKGFFAYGEWEKSGIKMNSNDKSNKTWKDNYFIGVGKKFLIHPKLYLTTTALYNLNNEDNNPVHPRRFQMRIGFQVSELATRKKRIYYDPNR